MTDAAPAQDRTEPGPEARDLLPFTPIASITTPDGRTLACAEDRVRRGFPVFYFHGTPSSRLEAALAAPAARRHGFRLIAVDRPGFGRSSFQPGRQFLDWPTDVLALADALVIDRFGIAGFSGAGPHLFACGAAVPPHRLGFIGALGPWGPLADLADLNAVDRVFASWAKRFPPVARLGFAPMGWTARAAPSLFLRLLKRGVSPADQAMLSQEGIGAIAKATFQEAFRQGSRGCAYEAMLAYGDWGFDLGSVRTPTFIALGTDDVFVSKAMGRRIADSVCGARLLSLPGRGHFALEAWDDLFARCRQSLFANPG